MKKGLLVPLILFLFFSLSATLLSLTARIAATNDTPKSSVGFKVSGRNVISSPINQYFAANQPKTRVLASIGKGDSRPVLVDNFLSKNRSPMNGLGNVFVSTADKYGIDYRLLPAIAFQESTLGKNVPKGSNNAFGWAIYTGANSGAKFKDWQHAIETVASGLKTDYFSRGLTSVEAIQSRYSDGGGEWVYGVKYAMSEMAIN